MSEVKPNIALFFEQNPVFTVDDFVRYLGKSEKSRNVYATLSYHREKGRIERIQEGIYFVVRTGVSPEKMNPDPYLGASKLSADSVLAYHTALDILGYSHSVFHHHYYFSKSYKPALKFRNETYTCVVAPTSLINNSAYYFGTEKKEQLGMKITITGKERSFAEALERPKYCGGFEEMYRCLEKIPYLNYDILLKYLHLRKKKTLYAKAGFYLEQHRDDLYVDDTILRELEKYKPASKIYWEKGVNGSVLSRRWNLLVPKYVAERSWEEF
jgi:predicted transcriptional regulator of viral defense system